MKEVIVCLLLVCSIALGQTTTGTISVSRSAPTDIGVWSDYVFIVASEPPNNAITITLSEADTSSLTFSTTQVQLSPTVQSVSYRVKANDVGSYVVSYTIGGDTGSQFSSVGNTAFQFTYRSVAIDTFDSPTYIAQPSEPIKLYIKTPSTGDLTFTPTPGDSSVTFSSPIVISAGQLSTTFTFIGSAELGDTQVTWGITGAESDLYFNSLDDFYPFQIIKRPVIVPDFSGTVLLTADSTTLYVYTPDSVNQSLTVTPQAADTEFTPASFDFTPDGQVAQFSFKTTTPGSKDVFFYLSGADSGIYRDILPSEINVPKRTITVTAPSDYVLTNTSYLSILLSAPAATDVTVTLFASNLLFNTSSVSFSGNQTSYAVAINPFALGPDTISFLITGTDADFYYPIPDISIAVGGGIFIGPRNWYIPPLWVGVESDKIPIRVSWSPIHEVTLTLSAPDVKFNPPTLTFRNGSEQQYFTITPLYVNNDADEYPTTTVSFFLSGTDHTFFSAPADFAVNINRRTIQTAWSAHLYTGTRHLNKQYKVWVSANYVTKSDLFSVTPVSPYFSFKPAVLHFDSKTTRVSLIATVTGVVGSTQIDYIIGGRDGGWYSPISPDYVSTAIRPLFLYSAVLAPDDRVKGAWFDYPSASEIQGNHIYSFVLNSSVLPDSPLTITPKCNHAQFSPSSITFPASHAEKDIDLRTRIRDYDFYLPGLFLSANFSVKPLAAGTHEVWFELSGKDANYYDRPDHTWFTFRPVLRVSPEPAQGGTGRVLPPVFVVISLLLTLLWV